MTLLQDKNYKFSSAIIPRKEKKKKRPSTIQLIKFDDRKKYLFYSIEISFEQNSIEFLDLLFYLMI